MDDLISRQQAIDEFGGAKVDEGYCTEYEIGYNDGIDFAVSKLSVLPSAQPERKTGKWISNSPVTMKCDQCGYVIKDWKWNELNFCANCGADMRGGPG